MLPLLLLHPCEYIYDTIYLPMRQYILQNKFVFSGQNFTVFYGGFILDKFCLGKQYVQSLHKLKQTIQ